MHATIKTDKFKIEYSNSNVTDFVLWESHCHAQFELIGVLEGDISITVEGKSYRLSDGQAVIVPQLVYHTIRANKKGIYHRVTALFDQGAIPNVIRHLFERRNNEVSVFYCARLDELKKVCRQNNSNIYAPLIDSLMTQIFYDDIESTQSESIASTDEFLQKAIEYIDKNLSSKITLDDIAEYTSRSKSSFCHLFEKKMKISPKQYILQKRLALASKLISEGTSPTETAIRIGYENYSNFYRMYMKHFGKSPSENK